MGKICKGRVIACIWDKNSRFHKHSKQHAKLNHNILCILQIPSYLLECIPIHSSILKKHQFMKSNHYLESSKTALNIDINRS